MAASARARSPISSRERGLDRVVEIAAADHRHGLGQLPDRAGQAPRDDPARQQAGRERERDDGDERPALVGQDLLQPAVRAAHARLAGAAVDLPVHLGERGLQPALELALGEPVGLLAPAGVLQPEDAVGHGDDLALDALAPRRRAPSPRA